MSYMNRRDFTKISGAAVPVLAAKVLAEGLSHRPNILVIMTDQQFADAMSCTMGDKHIHTPHMDALAANGIRFPRAYSPNPLCMPMRASFVTGRYPHETGIQINGGSGKVELSQFPFMGKIFADAGYETAYFGKWHVEEKSKDVHGFQTFVEKNAQLDPAPAAAFLKMKHDRPFLSVASFLSPHEICQWARKEELPGGEIGDPPPLAERPPLLPNAGAPENETDIMAHMRKAYHGDYRFPVGDYTEDDWQRHSWGYYRLIERADEFVGTLLDALRKSGRIKDTVVVFLSDHGDCHGAHRWNQKTVFYDESSRVPFIVSWDGHTPRGVSDVLVNVGIDTIPTLCDFAGINLPPDLPGKSMKPIALGGMPGWERKYIVSQNHMVQCVPVDGVELKPEGRMVRSDRYKYCLYSEGVRRESLVDMDADAGEMVNQAGNPTFSKVLAQHRAYLREHAQRHNDATAMEMLQKI